MPYKDPEKNRACWRAYRAKHSDRWRGIDGYLKKWRNAHPEECREMAREYRAANREKIREHAREYRRRNPETVRETARNYRIRHLDGSRKRARKYHALHPETQTMLSTIQRMLKVANLPKTSRAQQYIGCTPGFLRNHLEEQFKPGMTWANYGAFWVVDHIVPLSWWDIKNHPEHLFEASHYSNLQPLWKEANMTKGDRHA